MQGPSRTCTCRSMMCPDNAKIDANIRIGHNMLDANRPHQDLTGRMRSNAQSARERGDIRHIGLFEYRDTNTARATGNTAACRKVEIARALGSGAVHPC